MNADETPQNADDTSQNAARTNAGPVPVVESDPRPVDRLRATGDQRSRAAWPTGVFDEDDDVIGGAI